MQTIDNPILQHTLDRVRAHLQASGGTITVEPVQYGVKLTLELGTGSASGTIYHSAKKKRLSWVPIPNGSPSLAKTLEAAVFKVIHGGSEAAGGGASRKAAPVNAEEAAFTCWIGTDEAGKGDLFGPLVVAGFVATREIVSELAGLGVRDSKELANGRIHRLAEELRSRYPGRFTEVVISPAKYNEIYPDFKSQGGINGILGWGHARVIRTLMEGPHPIDGAVVDRFAGEGRLLRHLPRTLTPKLVVRPKGESNLAVAAGAILARDRYDRALDNMEATLGFRPHAGSGSPAVKDLRRVAKDKPQELARYVKQHFSPVQKLGLL